MNIIIVDNHQLVDYDANATVHYLISMGQDAKFAKGNVMWLIDNRQERYYKRINQRQCVI